ncbi:MAG: hypothetical protein H6807_09765 [Planctomycetes bacterium]|nr:hypothetical protein [Planctomycetota bacterium]
MRALLARLRGRSYVWLGVLLIALPFVLFLILPQITEPAPSERVESDSFSKGALGHALLYDALEESGWKVERLRQTPRRNRARGEVVVIAEPQWLTEESAEEILADLSIGDCAAVLVLPKRRPVLYQNGELLQTEIIPESEVGQIMHAFAADLELRRPETVDPGEDYWTALPVIGAVPRIRDLQLVSGPNLFPLVECRDGILVGVYSHWGSDILVISDPDLIANHGLGSVDAHVLLATWVFRRMALGRTTIYFDEVVHGHDYENGFWRRMMQYPLVLVLLHGILVMAVLVWAAARAFGPRLPQPPAVPPGKAFLVDHVASIIRLGRHDDYLVLRYLDESLREVAGRVHVESGPLKQIEERLAARSRARQLDFDPKKWREAARRGKKSAVDTALEIHRWKEEMIHGSRFDPRTRRGRS